MRLPFVLSARAILAPGYLPTIFGSGVGGPFEHKWAGGDFGDVCRVCGCFRVTTAGCPVGVDMATLPESRPLSTARQAEKALVALRAIWAAEKEVKERR